MGILYDILSLTRRRHCSGLGGICALSALAGFPLTWKVSESQVKSGNFVGGQGILVACERKRRFLSTFQGKVAYSLMYVCTQFVIFFVLLCLFTLSGLKYGNDSTGSRCRGGGAD